MSFINRGLSRINTHRGGVSLRSDTALDLAQLRQRAPAIFAETPHASRSDRYVTIPTGAVLEALEREGFRPFAAASAGSRDETRRGHAKHMVRLRHASAEPVTRLGGLIPEIVLINASDGSAAYNLICGLFRMVCTNGLMVAAGDVDRVRVPHHGRPDQIVHNVISGSYRVLEQAPRAIEAATTWSQVTMTQPQQAAFAREALAVRWPDPEKPAPVDAAAIVAPRRTADALPDVWSVFNRVQENITQGGQRYRLFQRRHGITMAGQRRTVGAVHSIDDDRRINQQLWAMADATAQALTVR